MDRILMTWPAHKYASAKVCRVSLIASCFVEWNGHRPVCPRESVLMHWADCCFFLLGQIINKNNVQEQERETDGYFIRSGIVTVFKDATIPAGTVI
jgi:hypothetical protein